MNQLDKLKLLVSHGIKTNNKTSFKGLVVVDLGVEPKPHYPKIKNADGTNKLDADGQPVKASQADGFTHTLAEVGTCTKVMIVLSRQYDLELMGVYSIGGLGYAMRSSNLIFIDEQATIANYK